MMRLYSALNHLTSAPLYLARRKFSQLSLRAKEASPINENSLAKTLQAHRYANRRKLIRWVGRPITAKEPPQKTSTDQYKTPPAAKEALSINEISSRTTSEVPQSTDQSNVQIRWVFSGASSGTIRKAHRLKALDVRRSVHRRQIVRQVFDSYAIEEEALSTPLPGNTTRNELHNRLSGSNTSQPNSNGVLLGNTEDLATDEDRFIDELKGLVGDKKIKERSKHDNVNRPKLNKPLDQTLSHNERPFPEQASPWHLLSWNVNKWLGESDETPWLVHLNPRKDFSSGVSQLNAEILALERHLSPTLAEQRTIQQVTSDVNKVLAKVSHAPQLMGSWRTGFAMSHSDLNFLLPVQDPLRSVSSIRSPSPARPQMLRLHREVLEKVETALRKSPKYSLELERTSSQGLAAIHEPTGLRIQFQCGEGIPASVEYIRDYHAEYPILRSLYMTTRLILETKKLFGSDSESIRSETLIMVLAAFLKMNHGRFRREDSCAQALLAFLRSLGLEINLASTGIAVDPPGLFNAGSLKAASRIYKSENEDLPAHLRGQYALLKTKRGTAARKPAAASQLCVQDPANYMNDLGRSCKRTPEIQAGFAKAYKSLQEALSLWEEPEPQATRKSILNNVLHANFHAFHLRRRLLGNPM